MKRRFSKEEMEWWEMEEEIAEKYLSKKELTEKIGISASTLEHWIERGWLVKRKIGRKVLFERAELREAIIKNKSMRRRIPAAFLAELDIYDD